MERFEPKRPDNMTGGSEIPESMNRSNPPKHHPVDNPQTARDGFDNTGTQGYDSLSDEGYTGSSDSGKGGDPESHTGSSSEDFNTVPDMPENELSDEDRVLDSGI